ncbi:hypothetical protein AXF42_Ash015964 [Apostasia shenzhenica]|uniref:DUF4228 domain-containing protein n=1 Tax=Apostasia shenzhenica TaxID=1088818 RepID=A0A2I0AWL3_9ASPA|nr:hypothetical protein AXF42_Ash015964 [Apostasia shenzhenica]
MGNCQAAEAATVVIQHPGGRIERIYWSLSASQVMASNPGHYVAVIITSQPAPNSGRTGAAAAPVKHLKLLRPDDTLHIGQVYRLVSFEEVLREFSSKKHVRLSRLLIANKEKRQIRSSGDGGGRTSSPATVSSLINLESFCHCLICPAFNRLKRREPEYRE